MSRIQTLNEVFRDLLPFFNPPSYSVLNGTLLVTILFYYPSVYP